MQQASWREGEGRGGKGGEGEGREGEGRGHQTSTRTHAHNTQHSLLRPLPGAGRVHQVVELVQSIQVHLQEVLRGRGRGRGVNDYK